MLGAYQISVIIAIIILALAVIRDRRNWKFGFVSMRRSQLGVNLIKRAVELYPGLFRVLGGISISVCSILMAFGFVIVGLGLYVVFTVPVTGPTGGLLLPNIFSNEVVGGVGYLLIPFWYWILAIPLIMIPHEFMHGVFSAYEKIRIKSVGLMLLAFVIPGAFVEPDDKQLNKKSTYAKVKVASGGSFANFLMWILFAFIATMVWNATVDPNGIELANVTEGSPAWEAGLRPGMVITSMNDVPTETFADFSNPFKSGPFIKFYAPNLRINESINYTLSDGTVLYGRVGEHPEVKGMGYLGLREIRPLTEYDWASLYQLLGFFNWLIILELWIGIFNILPIYPLDGGLILRYLLESRFKKSWRRIVYPVAFAFLAVFLIMIFGPYVRGLF